MREFNSIDELNAYLKSIQSKLTDKNLQYQLNSAGKEIKNVIEESFLLQADPTTGKKWQALKLMTKMKKLRKGGSGNILRDGGNLQDNWEIAQGNNQVHIFNNSKAKGFAYGIVHQFGSEKTEFKLRTSIFLKIFESQAKPKQIQIRP